MVMPVVYTTPAFSTLKNGDFWKRCRPRFSLKTPGLRFSANGPKRRLLKTMAWLPTFSVRILDDCVNNNIMLIVLPGRFPIQPLQASGCVCHLYNRESSCYTYLWLYLHKWSCDMRFRLCSVQWITALYQKRLRDFLKRSLTVLKQPWIL